MFDQTSGYALHERAFSFWLAFSHNDDTHSLKLNS